MREMSAFEKRVKRQVIGKPHRFLAVVPLGFEQTLANEIQSIGNAEPLAEFPRIVGDGKVEFTAKITEAWKIVAFSRIANRILMHLADFKAENFREFEKKASEIPWELYLDDSSALSLNIHVTCKHSRLYHSDAIAERLQKVIEDSFSKGGSLPLAPADAASATPSAGTPRNAPLNVIPVPDPVRDKLAGISSPTKFFEQHLYATFLDDRCTIWLDLAGEELYKRGHERFVNDAPLKETIAAGMLFEAIHLAQKQEILRLRATHGVYPEQSRRAQDDTRERNQTAPSPISHSALNITLFDLMAGSGTFSLEAAYTANKIIPGVCRDFALKHQPAFKEATWNYIIKNLEPASKQPGATLASNLKIVTSDISDRAIEIIRHNVESSPLAGIAPNGDTPNPQHRDFFSYTAKEIAETSGDSAPILVLNPPYGKRLDFDAPKLYTKIGRHLAALASELKPLGKQITVAILAPKDDSREGSKFTCTANLLHECPALSPENNSAAKHIVTSHGGLTLNTFIAKLS